MSRTLEVERLLAAPGRRPAGRDARLTMAGGRVAAIDVTDGTRSDGSIALPAMVNAHDHGYGVRPLALGGTDDALECWIASLTRVTVEPRLEAAVAFGRMALAGIGATVHCHNSLVADQLEIRGGRSRPRRGRRGDSRGLLLPDPGPQSLGLRRPARPAAAPAPGRPGNGHRGELSPTVPPAHRPRRPGRGHRGGARERAVPGAVRSRSVRSGASDATLERIAEAAAANNRRVHMHLLESRRQREWLDGTYRQGIVRYLDDIGLLSPRLTVAHGVHLTDEECALMAERGVTVAVNTSCNLRMRSGVAPVARFMHHGLAFGFGLDGCAHDDDQDYFRDLRLAWRLHNGTGLAQALPPGRLFDAACRHGFRCIDGSDDYGEDRPRRPGRPGGARLRRDDR